MTRAEKKARGFRQNQNSNNGSAGLDRDRQGQEAEEAIRTQNENWNGTAPTESHNPPGNRVPLADANTPTNSGQQESNEEQR